MSFVTRFKRRIAPTDTFPTGALIDGPVSGSIQILPVQFTNGATNSTYAHAIDLPAGMQFEITDINVQALGITSDPSLTVGTAKAGTQIVAAVNVTTNLGSATLKSTSVTAGGVLEVRIANDTGDAFDSIAVNIVGYVTAPPTSLVERNINHA